MPRFSPCGNPSRHKFPSERVRSKMHPRAPCPLWCPRPDLNRLGVAKLSCRMTRTWLIVNILKQATRCTEVHQGEARIVKSGNLWQPNAQSKTAQNAHSDVGSRAICTIGRISASALPQGSCRACRPFTQTAKRRSPKHPGASINSTFSVLKDFRSRIEIRNRAGGRPCRKHKSSVRSVLPSSPRGTPAQAAAHRQPARARVHGTLRASARAAQWSRPAGCGGLRFGI